MIDPLGDAQVRLGIDWRPGECVVLHSTVRLGWLDRLRVLLGRPIRLRSHVWTEHEPGRHAAETPYTAVDPLYVPRVKPQISASTG